MGIKINLMCVQIHKTQTKTVTDDKINKDGSCWENCDFQKVKQEQWEGHHKPSGGVNPDLINLTERLKSLIIEINLNQTLIPRKFRDKWSLIAAKVVRLVRYSNTPSG